MKTPPTKIDGVEVQLANRDPIVIKGRRWLTLIPIDEDEDGIWEWSPDTGEVLRTQ